LANTGYTVVALGAVVFAINTLKTIFFVGVVAHRLAALTRTYVNGAFVVVATVLGRTVAFHGANLARRILGIAPVAIFVTGATVFVVAWVADIAPFTLDAFFWITTANLAGRLFNF
jgi:sulfite exporter TauE/SafE